MAKDKPTNRKKAKPPLSAGKRWLKRLKLLTGLAISLCIIMTVAVVVGLLYLRSQALPASSFMQTSQIVDIDNQVIGSFSGGQNRRNVPLKEISPYLAQATVDIEDRRFYDHFGFDPRGIARAVWVDIRHMAKVQGASTLTQQLARNLYLSHERTWTRKVKEALFTVQLEMQYSKDDILNQYMNQVYYGHGAYGVQAAAKLYFNKDAKDLSLAESAMLAGIPKSWKYYSPFMNMENAKSRQKLVLQSMVAAEHITQIQADQAYAEKLSFASLEERYEPSPAAYFRDYVKKEAARRLGVKEEQIEQGGITIYTTLDLKAQKKAEAAVTKELKDSPDLQAALISIDPRNGYIKAMVGGRDYKENQYNRVFATTRQPGSSFKPFVYLTALHEKNFTPLSRFRSEPTVFTYDDGRKTYTPSNFGDEYPDDPSIDLEYAIAHSDNIYAVNTIMQVGPDKVIDTARKLGVTSKLKSVPSLALGTSPVSPFEMASAFGVIANQGIRVEPTAILKIVDTQGNVLYEATPKETRVEDPAYTYVLTRLMESVFEPGGTASRVASIIKRPVAGKTGTTDSDAWMVGFTPELSTAVWVGYDKGKVIGTLDSRKAAPIFAEYMENALEAIPPKIFPVPKGVVSVYVDPDTGKLATTNCPDSKFETFVKGTEPTEYCSVHGKAEEQNAKGDKEQNSTWWEDLKHWWNN